MYQLNPYFILLYQFGARNGFTGTREKQKGIENEGNGQDMIHDNKEGPYTTMDPSGGPDAYKQSKHTPCQAVKKETEAHGKVFLEVEFATPRSWEMRGGEGLSVCRRAPESHMLLSGLEITGLK